ncbi:MAG: hypothetical protein Q7U51_06020 [Methanoregula sp.]|nr:hypothetical protein [Methanoregula sp.]
MSDNIDEQILSLVHTLDVDYFGVAVCGLCLYICPHGRKSGSGNCH